MGGVEGGEVAEGGGAGEGGEVAEEGGGGEGEEKRGAQLSALSKITSLLKKPDPSLKSA